MLQHHPYACGRCRLRRVKCDKVKSGCTNCTEARAQCTYSARRPRKTQAQKASGPSPAADTTTKNAMSEVGPDLRLGSSDESRVDGDEDDVVVPRELRDTKFESRYSAKNSDYGRLFVAQGKSRYIDSGKADQVKSIPLLPALSLSHLLSF